jgi:hypothetical protein
VCDLVPQAVHLLQPAEFAGRQNSGAVGGHPGLIGKPKQAWTATAPCSAAIDSG